MMEKVSEELKCCKQRPVICSQLVAQKSKNGELEIAAVSDSVSKQGLPSGCDWQQVFLHTAKLRD